MKFVSIAIELLQNYPKSAANNQKFGRRITGVVIVDWSPSRIYAKKLIIAGWGIVLATVPLFLIFGRVAFFLLKPNLIIVWSYVGPLLAAIFLFSRPDQGEKP
jgi:hypothetical protein